MDQDLKSLFESAIAETGIDLQQSAHDVALYTSLRSVCSVHQLPDDLAVMRSDPSSPEVRVS